MIKTILITLFLCASVIAQIPGEVHEYTWLLDPAGMPCFVDLGQPTDCVGQIPTENAWWQRIAPGDPETALGMPPGFYFDLKINGTVRWFYVPWPSINRVVDNFERILSKDVYAEVEVTIEGGRIRQIWALYDDGSQEILIN